MTVFFYVRTNRENIVRSFKFILKVGVEDSIDSTDK
jgi:hypothetical protein